ncbi:MAG: hypothetical protein HY526_01735 [Betaproteobacteria bacterium]|nr:hypothetical protein [Betaproteobacteria bacterium]
MSKTDVFVQRDGVAYRIELNRPDCGNLVTMEMVTALAEALRDVPRDAKRVVLRGRGVWSELGGRASTFIEAVAAHPLDAVKAVKEYLTNAPLMERRGGASYAAALFATVLSTR